jgi:hypothetical protein
VFYALSASTALAGTCQISQVRHRYLACSPRSLTPAESPRSSFPPVLAACCVDERIGFRYLVVTRLNCFTLSHCGSHASLPTLKPHLTASAPRLGTDCLLNFIRPGVSPDSLLSNLPNGLSDTKIAAKVI